MPETNEIQPALTPEEWAMEKVRIAVGEVVADHGIPADEAHKTVALANFCLPDDDPRRITAADVAELQRIANLDAEAFVRIFNDGDGHLDVMDSDAANVASQSLSRIAAKLAALLPPER